MSLRERYRRQIHDAALQYSTTTVDSLEFAVRYLFGAGRTVSPQVREAVEEGAYYSRLAVDRLWYFYLALLMVGLSAVDTLIQKGITGFLFGGDGEPLGFSGLSGGLEWGGQWLEEWLLSVDRYTPAAWLMVTQLALLTGAVYWTFRTREFRQVAEIRSARITWKRYDVPSLCALLIGLCALARMVAPDQRKDVLRRIDIAVAMLTRALLKIPSDGQIFPRRSARRKAVREHVKLVAAALQKATLRLDERPHSAPREVAALAFLICNRYVGQRWGALLDARQLAGLSPVHDREAIRLAVAVTLSVGAAVGTVALGVPATAATWIMGGVAVLVFTGLLGRGPKGLELLDSLRGIQRP
ncbi:hypothetical protein ACFTZ8_26850 [Streptomyces fungicidicus]|uniref:hypothetical protein n=1 Tax=Streptomyces fungicidicus TaxID=68203 RepID=UPI003634F41B